MRPVTVSINNSTQRVNAALLNPSLRLLAPNLISYNCELQTLIENIEADDDCAAMLIRYANRRQNEPDSQIESVRHAVVFLGLIDTKQFLFAYLLVDANYENRSQTVALLTRAKLTSDLFKTTGPLNKDLAFIGALMSNLSQLKMSKPETIFMLFKMPVDSKNAIRNYDYGLRSAIKQAMLLVTKCNPSSSKREMMPAEFEMMYQDSVYWANLLVSTLEA
jgi:c-di-GMP-related signal transduction protein